ncbi:MAG: DUF1353 domain-containing protein [Desulfobacula sp.]|uniref:LamG-like jellyroll fold domain-containing protein n=1 Tax=Desulfobacula sp. TaxID=2593537 RepID=UPI0025C15C32|nr:LamG-like jellyroll fold domain-containing protein [Desulfobacula sp.]MCD4722474.1 DUF1353 domain-containing protein [Desulfobacula sp.]
MIQKATLGMIFVLVFIAFAVLPVNATDDAFEYIDGPTGGGLDTILYYEVAKDYTIDIKKYLSVLSELPGPYFKWDRTETQRQMLLQQLDAISRVLIKWEFIELEAGVLTVKKGYRWDGASTPWNTLNIANNREFYIRCSCIHDSMYDLMRMGYLDHDRIGNNFNDSGFRNRLIADILLYMIVVDDGRDEWWAQNVDFEFVRAGGFAKTHDDDLLSPFKYHVSKLTTWASEGNVDLRFLPADISLNDPNHYGHLIHPYHIYRWRIGGSPVPELLATIENFNPAMPDYYNKEWDVFYTDTDVDNAQVYIYKAVSAIDEDSLGWKDRHHDQSNAEAVAIPVGNGNALVLDGINDYVEANLVSNDLRARGYLFSVEAITAEAITFEAWVYPEPQAGKASVLAFNTSSGGNYNLLMYDGDNQKFCYFDNIRGFIQSTIESLPGHWYHVAVAIKIAAPHGPYRGTLYVNGEEQVTFTPSITPSRTALFSIGQEWDSGSASNHFKGRIDEVRIWNNELSQADIQAGMWFPMKGDEEGLIGLWHFDEPSTLRSAFDATTNGNDGTLSGYNAPDTAFVPSGAMKFGDIDGDGDVDGSDLSGLAGGIVAGDYDVRLLAGFAGEYGITTN